MSAARILPNPIAIIVGSLEYSAPFESMFECYSIEASDHNWYDHIVYADIVVFTGGKDVDPSMYGEAKYVTTDSDIERDINEAIIYEYCRDKGTPMVGISRGAQFLSVMNGSKLVQRLIGHNMGKVHDMTAILKQSRCVTRLKHMNVNSTHHQMMYPWNLNRDQYQVKAYAGDVADGFYRGEPACDEDAKVLTGKTHAKEPEVVYYPETECLCVQFHPEEMDRTSEGFIYFQDLVESTFLEN